MWRLRVNISVSFAPKFLLAARLENMELTARLYRCLSLLLLVTMNIATLVACGGGNSTIVTPPPNQNPVPSITKTSPTAMPAQSSDFTLTVTGTGFISSSQIEWNAAPVSTSYDSNTQLQAQIPASSVASSGTVNITVVSPAPGGGTSNVLHFSVSTLTTNVKVVDVEGNDVVWDSQRNKMYVSVPGTATSNPSSIAVVDPIAGTVERAQTTNPDPGILALSDDGQLLYTSISGDVAVQRFSVAGYGIRY